MSNGGNIENPIAPNDLKISDSSSPSTNATQNGEENQNLEEFKRRIEQQAQFRRTEREKNLHRSSPSLLLQFFNL